MVSSSSLPSHPIAADWPNVLQRVRQKRRTVHALLAEARALDVDEQTLSVFMRPGYEFHAEQLNKADTKRVVKDAVQEVTGFSLEPVASVLSTDPRDNEALRQYESNYGPVYHLADSHATAEVASKVFVVHGRSVQWRESLARVLTQLGVEHVIVGEESSAGQTLIEKVESHAQKSTFAVALLTGDDVGALTEQLGGPEGLESRARQNVILELGFLMGRLGRSKTAILYEDGVSLPSDIQGMVYIKLDSAGAWQYQLARELRKAGFSADANRL